MDISKAKETLAVTLGTEQANKLMKALEAEKASMLLKLKALAAPIVAALALAGMTALGLDHSAQEEAVSAACKAAAEQLDASNDTDTDAPEEMPEAPQPDVGEAL